MYPHSTHHGLGHHGIGRHRGRGSFGHPPGDFGHGPFGGHGFPGGRKLGAGDLQLVILALLAEQPAHGYELIRQLEERSGGFYVPSPGVIYPALTYLEEIGHTSVAPEGNRKQYAITDAGRAHLQAHAEAAAAILEALARVGGRMANVREAFAGLADADPRSPDELHAARHELKHALARKHGCSAEEARRIARILRQAAADIIEPAS